MKEDSVNDIYDELEETTTGPTVPWPKKKAYRERLLDSEAFDYYAKGMLLFKSRNYYPETIKLFKKAISRGLDDEYRYSAYLSIGICYFETGMYKLALSNFTKANELDTDDLESLIFIGQCLARLNKFHDAEIKLKEAFYMCNNQNQIDIINHELDLINQVKGVYSE